MYTCMDTLVVGLVQDLVGVEGSSEGYGKTRFYREDGVGLHW